MIRRAGSAAAPHCRIAAQPCETAKRPACDRPACAAGTTRRRVLAVGLGTAAITASAAPRGWRAAADSTIPIIDAHAHLARSLGRAHRRGGDLEAEVSAALALMGRFGVALAVLSPPPFPADRTGAYDAGEQAAVVRAHPGRFAFTAGGGSLNPLIQETSTDRVTADLASRFAREAAAIAAAGAAAFGELAAEHFSSRRGNHPYETAPPDHPLLLALADIAAGYGMPVELHMEAVPRDMPFPNRETAGPPNPPNLRANIAAFARLLDHNRRARIVWLHAGWDLSGERTVPLMRSLLEAHPNLYMSVKSDPAGSPQTAPFQRGGGLKPGWLAMLRAFPDRFVIGSDQFYDTPSPRTGRARRLVDLLPADLAPLVAYENARRIYRLPAAGH